MGEERPPLNHFGIKGRANFPKLPQQSTTENSTADAVKSTNRRTESRALSRVANSRADCRTGRRAKSAADQSVTHNIPLVAIIVGIALCLRIVGRLRIVGAIRLLMHDSWSLVMVHMFFYIDLTGPIVMAITMTRTTIMSILVAVPTMAAIMRHCLVAFIHSMIASVGPVLVTRLCQ